MTSAEESALKLARRLRSLRKQSWPGTHVTQEMLAQAFNVSVPLISSWERHVAPALPPQRRLDAYATFFATARSVERRPFQLIIDLTDDELASRAALLAELTELRDDAVAVLSPAPEARAFDNPWCFPSEEDITLVCSVLPDRVLDELACASPEDPDYVELYRYTDLDALLELHGHIRALNPDNNIRVLPGSGPLPADAYTSHLVFLGDSNRNQIATEVLHRSDIPLEQQARTTDADPGGFDALDDGLVRKFQPIMRQIESRRILEEDVAHFYRALNPFNRKRSVTFCRGAHSRGTLGAVRALTDPRFRDRNTSYVRSRFAGSHTFSVLCRVHVFHGSVVTPDWTTPEFRLHEWPVGHT